MEPNFHALQLIAEIAIGIVGFSAILIALSGIISSEYLKILCRIRQITPKKTMPLNMTFQIFSRFLLFFLCLRFLIILQTCIRKILLRH